MKLFHRIDDLGLAAGPVHLAIGVFDGFHLGHQAVVRQAMAGAEQSGGTAVLVTFEPHPAKVLRPDPPRILTHGAHKLRLCEEFGLTHALVIDFGPDFARHSGAGFVSMLHQASSQLHQICVGRDWVFGNNRDSNFATLQQLGQTLGFAATGIDPVMAQGVKVSSTRIREAVRAGEFALAKQLLGRAYSVLGEVKQGRKLGRELGFSTANLEVFNEQLPPQGVYAAQVRKSDRWCPAVANLGVRPTIPGGDRLLEVHLLDYSGPDFYGDSLEVCFEQFLRQERKFSGLEALADQVHRDVETARAWFRL